MEHMRNDVDISEFLSYLEASTLANVSLEFKSVTVFAPTNSAFQKLTPKFEDKNALVLYHMTSVPKKIEQLGSSYTSLNSELEGNPPLWITHTSDTYHNDIYVNNARIHISRSNKQGRQARGKEQVLHIIDEVLIPTTSPSSATRPLYNPTALEFLENYESLIQGPHRVRNFRQRVSQTNKQDIFKNEGGHTFFIPVDEGFANGRAQLIDSKIIDGHVIPKQVLFTAPTKKDVPFQTLANSDNDVRVVISFTQEKRGTAIVNYVKSHTLFGSSKHTQGVVLAEIVKANIPVKNGVIHLIHKPLMVVDSNVKALLTEKQDGILSSFLTAINDVKANDFLRHLEHSKDVTLFAPCNSALEGDLTLNSIRLDQRRFMDILNMHLVVGDRLYVDKILKNSQNTIYQAHTLNRAKNLYFNVATIGGNKTMTVEGGGVNATVIQADLAATNGIIHIIDRVLGVPYSTVLDKLRTDPMLRDTYYLGNLQGFNNQLNDTTKKFTYFVPRDRAWRDARVALPSAIKKLFMREYAYHATTTLERHLVISDTPYTMERIKMMTNNSRRYQDPFNAPREIELPTMRGSLRLYVEERQDNTFIIHWKGEKIPVFRPNVECTNGIIHVIDMPFLQEGDIRVSGATNLYAIAPQLLMIVVAKLLIL